MTKIEELQQLDLDKLPVALKKEIEELLTDYNRDPDKDKFTKHEKANIDMLFGLAQKVDGGDKKKRKYTRRADKAQLRSGLESESIERNEDDEEGKSVTKRKAKSNAVLNDVLTVVSSNIEECRKAIRDENKRRREAEGVEPRPKKSRITKLKEKLLAIASLIPESLKGNSEVRSKTQKTLLTTLNELKKTWRLNIVKQAQDAIKEKFDEMDEQQRKAA